MYDVSSSYRTQIKDKLRNPSYMKIELDVYGPQAKEEASITTDSELSYSDIENIKYDHVINDEFITLEKNRFILDGLQTLPSSSSSMNQEGYIGQLVSDENGVWSTNPTITIDFGTNYHSPIGLTFDFDVLYGTYPKEIVVKAFYDLTEVFSDTVYPDKADNWEMLSSVPYCNKITITGINSNIPYSRFRVQKILLGLTKSYNSDVITKTTWKREFDLITSKLPTYTFDFTIIDINKEYNPDNPNGTYQYLEERQPIRFYYGYELNDGTIEWIKGGQMVTSDDISVDAQSKIQTISFKTTSILSTLTDVYRKGIYNSTPVSLYSLAEELLEYAELPLDENGLLNYEIDASLMNIYTSCPLPNEPLNVLLQLIANAGMCTLRVNRDGKIRIVPEEPNYSGFAMTFTEMYKAPKIKKYPKLLGVDTKINTISVATEYSNLYEADIVGANATTYEFEYSDATDISAVAGSGLSIIGTPSFYATYCSIVLTGTGTLTISGKELTYGNRLISVEFDISGERCSISNELIVDYDQAINYANWIGTFEKRRNEYEIEDRGFPELDADNIRFDTLLMEALFGTVFSSEISYNGTLSGKTKVLTASKLFNEMYNYCGTTYCGQGLTLPQRFY